MGSSLALWPTEKLPDPLAVGQALGQLAVGASLVAALAASLGLMLLGYLLSVAVGVPFGVAVSQSRWLRTTVGPALLGLQTLPSVCWLPLALLWFGANLQAVLFVVLANTAFAVAGTTAGAIAQVPPLLVEAGQTLGARKWTLVTRVLLPAAWPGIVAGLRSGWTFAWRALMAAELIVPGNGLGRLLQRGRERGDIAEIIATMLVIVAIGLLVEMAVFGRLERRLRHRRGLADT